MKKDIFDLNGKVALVTGASKGIGESIARFYAAYGAKVIINSRKQDAVNEVANDINTEGGEAIGVAGQVGSIEDCKKIFDAAMSAYGRIDILVNNAATNPVFGSIINISSIGGVSPEQMLGIYSVSKAALISLTKVMAAEWGKDNIRANVICPGLIQTKFSQALWSNDQIMKHMMAQLPLSRVGKPEEIAGLALFLASEASSYCTGSVFMADGGYLI